MKSNGFIVFLRSIARVRTKDMSNKKASCYDEDRSGNDNRCFSNPHFCLQRSAVNDRMKPIKLRFNQLNEGRAYFSNFPLSSAMRASHSLGTNN